MGHKHGGRERVGEGGEDEGGGEVSKQCGSKNNLKSLTSELLFFKLS